MTWSGPLPACARRAAATRSMTTRQRRSMAKTTAPRPRRQATTRWTVGRRLGPRTPWRMRTPARRTRLRPPSARSGCPARGGRRTNIARTAAPRTIAGSRVSVTCWPVDLRMPSFVPHSASAPRGAHAKPPRLALGRHRRTGHRFAGTRSRSSRAAERFYARRPRREDGSSTIRPPAAAATGQDAAAKGTARQASQPGRSLPTAAPGARPGECGDRAAVRDRDQRGGVMIS